MLVPWLSVSLRAFGTSINRTALDKISKKFDKVQKSKIRYMNREVTNETIRLRLRMLPIDELPSIDDDLVDRDRTTAAV
eukprot:m.66767 g.66767  ORF g.66767 m.66767 type:complete len:79 (-) comp9830_c0_seq4:5287-5523(-)